MNWQSFLPRVRFRQMQALGHLETLGFPRVKPVRVKLNSTTCLAVSLRESSAFLGVFSFASLGASKRGRLKMAEGPASTDGPGLIRLDEAPSSLGFCLGLSGFLGFIVLN